MITLSEAQELHEIIGAAIETGDIGNLRRARQIAGVVVSDAIDREPHRSSLSPDHERAQSGADRSETWRPPARDPRDIELTRFCDLLTDKIVHECRRPVVLKSEPQRLTRGEIAACELTVSAQLANGKRGTYGEHHGAHESSESPEEERERAGVDRMEPWQP